MSGRFLIALLLLLLAPSQGFDVSGPSDYTPGDGNYQSSDYKGVFVAMIVIGCAAMLMIYFCCKPEKIRTTSEDEMENIEMYLSGYGSAVIPRLASAMAVPDQTGSNSARAKRSCSSNNAVYV